MKKNMKKNLMALLSIPISSAVVVGSAHGHNKKENIETMNINRQTNIQNTNANVNNDGEIVFNGNTYLNIEDAINDFLSKDGVITQKLYLGDVDNATSKNDYNTINLKKLKEVTSSNVVNAYKTLTDNYTSDLSEAKKSYLQNPVIKWVDNQNNEYDSETEARYAMQNNGDYYTNPIAYYEIKDYSQKDEYGRPTVVKINPLNEKDLNTLKTIALKNALISGSDFSIQRYSVDPLGLSSNYSNSDNFKGMSNEEVTATTNKLAKSAISSLTNNIWLNTRVDAVPDRDKATLTYSNGYLHPGPTWIKFQDYKIEFWVNGYDSSAYTNLAQIKEDAKYLMSDYDYYKSKFTIERSPCSLRYVNGSILFDPVFWMNSNGQGIFGGQKYNFDMKDIEQFLRDTYVNPNTKGLWLQYSPQDADKFLGTNDISFMGHGNKINGYFKLNINQNNIDSMLNNPTTRKSFEDKKSSVESSVSQILTQQFQDLSLTDDASKQYISQVSKIASDLLTQNIFGKDSVETEMLKNTLSTQNIDDNISGLIVKKLDDVLKSKGMESLSDKISNQLKLKYQVQDSKSANNTIYTISYNGQPLYKFDKSLVSSFMSNSEYNANPLDTVRKYISNQVSANYTQFINDTASKLVNISNKYNFANNTLNFKMESLDNYNDATKSNGEFKLDNTQTSPTGFNNDVKLFDESVFANNKINTSNLEKQLNRRDTDNASNLNSQFGTFEAIYQYNKTLKEIWNDQNATDTLKNNVNENALKNVNDVVVLYDKSKQPQTIKYGEYLNYGYKFNVSLSDNNVRVLNSDEARRYEINLEGLDIPSKKYTYYDYDGNILLSDYVALKNGSYDGGASQLYQNALNRLVVPASSNYVFYINPDGSKELIKNKTTKLNVLSITDASGKVYQYGFTNYNDLQNYVSDYIKGNVGLPNFDDTPMFNRKNSDAILNGFLTSLAIIIIAEVVVMSYAFVKSNKNFNTSLNKKYNFR